MISGPTVPVTWRWPVVASLHHMLKQSLHGEWLQNHHRSQRLPADGIKIPGIDFTPPWICWFVSMASFCYIVYGLLVGLATETAQEAAPVMRGKIQTALAMTVIYWCTYLVVYLVPMLGISDAAAAVFILVGYCASDIISRYEVGIDLPNHICQA